jgi:DNA mismatch repair ATPase MutL
MKLPKLLSTAVLVFLPGAIVPVCAQEHRDQEKPPEQKQQQAKPAPQQQRAEQKQQQAKPAPQQQQRAEQKQQPAKPAPQQQRAEQKQQPAKPAPQQQQRAEQKQQPAKSAAPGGSHGRIPDDRFRASFGSGHTFHVNRSQFAGGSRRFQYGGYWFAMANPWPVGWLYTDSVYVDYINGGYFLCDPVHPGVNISINIG